MSEFLPENRLEELLVRAATDPSARPDFYRELCKSTLFVLTPNAPAGETTAILAQATSVSLVQWNGPSGPVTPFFSSKARLDEVARRAGKPLGFLGLEGTALLQLLAQEPHAAVLNPGFAYGKQLVPAEIRGLADGSIFATGEPVVAERATRVLLGQPSVYPTPLVDALKRLFEQRESMEAAYLAQAHFEGAAHGPHPIVGLVSSNYRKDVEDAGMVAQQVGEPSPVDFVDLRGREGGVIVRHLLDKTKPFFERAARPAESSQ